MIRLRNCTFVRHYASITRAQLQIILNEYARKGDVEQASRVFDEMRDHIDADMVTAMLRAHFNDGRRSRVLKAARWFGSMRREAKLDVGVDVYNVLIKGLLMHGRLHKAYR